MIKILSEYISSDVVEYILIDYILPSKEGWRKKFDSVLKELNIAIDITRTDFVMNRDLECSFSYILIFNILLKSKWLK